MAEVAFASLNPSCRQHPGCSIRLQFNCPVCGPPYTIDIPIVLNGEGAQVQLEVPKWTATTTDLSWDHLTVTPSINNTPAGHGRKKACTFHGSIVDGKVLFP